MPSRKGIGTRLVGYAGPEMGPFQCQNCAWFKPTRYCTHPEVKEDDQIPKEKTDFGVLAKVSPLGCCNEFRPVSPIGDTPFEKVGL